VIQNEMDVQCQLVTHGSPLEDFQTLAAKRLEDTTRDWIMLLQLDTDDSGPPGWMWGDAGCLYFWIRQQDLAAHRFERCWTILQC